MQIPKKDLISIVIGVWEFNFACNKDLKSPNLTGGEATTFALRYSSCPVCNSTSKMHSIILVKPSLFMSDLDSNIKYKRANRLADKNDEWLVLRCDLIDKVHRCTRIQRADFWQARHYILQDEAERGVNFKYV